MIERLQGARTPIVVHLRGRCALVLGISAVISFHAAFPQVPADSAFPLIPPLLLKTQERRTGNPLATYSSMLTLEERYRSSPLEQIFKDRS